MKLSYLKKRLDCDQETRLERLSYYIKKGKAKVYDSKYAKIYEFNNITDRQGNKRPIKVIMDKENGTIEAYLV